jgi:hypothetical protein
LLLGTNALNPFWQISQSILQFSNENLEYLLNILNFTLLTMKEELFWGFLISIYPSIFRNEAL